MTFIILHLLYMGDEEVYVMDENIHPCQFVGKTGFVRSNLLLHSSAHSPETTQKYHLKQTRLTCNPFWTYFIHFIHLFMIIF